MLSLWCKLTIPQIFNGTNPHLHSNGPLSYLKHFCVGTLQATYLFASSFRVFTPRGPSLLKSPSEFLLKVGWLYAPNDSTESRGFVLRFGAVPVKIGESFCHFLFHMNFSRSNQHWELQPTCDTTSLDRNLEHFCLKGFETPDLDCFKIYFVLVKKMWCSIGMFV